MIPEWRACSIDTKFDLFIAEQVLEHYDELAAHEALEHRNESARA